MSGTTNDNNHDDDWNDDNNDGKNNDVDIDDDEEDFTCKSFEKHHTLSFVAQVEVDIIRNCFSRGADILLNEEHSCK